jgi:hypothetical protein
MNTWNVTISTTICEPADQFSLELRPNPFKFFYQINDKTYSPDELEVKIEEESKASITVHNTEVIMQCDFYGTSFREITLDFSEEQARKLTYALEYDEDSGVFNVPKEYELDFQTLREYVLDYLSTTPVSVEVVLDEDRLEE